MTKPNILWASGFFEGEGTIVIRKHKKGKLYPYLIIQIAQVDRRALDAFQEIVGGGKVRGPYGPYRPNKQPYYLYDADTKESLRIAEMLLPHLYAKGDQVRRVIKEYDEFKT